MLYNLSLLGPDYFQQAMKREAEQERPGRPVIFVVVSDDLAWAQQHMAVPGLRVAFLGNTAGGQQAVGEDLALLAACNHSIISYGTFGMWGALLAGGRVTISQTAAKTKDHTININIVCFPAELWLLLPVLVSFDTVILY